MSYYNDVYLTMFNALVTAIAICTIAVFDQDISFSDNKAKPLLDLFIPIIYKDTIENELFTKMKFLAWTIISIA
jgi:magnesium-transporting ATPase (P-type)